MLTIIGAFVLLCTYAARLSTAFALAAARPVYGLYPPLVACALVGASCALVCYAPTALAVVAFLALFRTDIRVSHNPPPPVGTPSRSPAPTPGPAAAAAPRARAHAYPSDTVSAAGVRWARVGWSLVRDGAATIKLALLVAPVYVLAAGRAGLAGGRVENRALEAAAGGQLAAALMTMRIMFVGFREIWDLVPMVVLRWDRDAVRERVEED